MAAKKTPKFTVKTLENSEDTVQIRVSRIDNGFMLKPGTKPIHYPDIESLAEAVKQGLLQTEWPSPS